MVVARWSLPALYDFGHSVVHHFFRAFNVRELTQLVSVGRAKAQEWCRRQGQTWVEAQGGVDFFGSPWSFKYVEPKDCCLFHIEWSICPYASLQEAEVLGKATTSASHCAPNTVSLHSGFDHEHIEWDMVHKPCRAIPVSQTAMQKHHVPENLPGRTTDMGLHQDARCHVFPEDSRQPLPELYMDPPLPSGPAPTISMAEAACVFSTVAATSYDSCLFPVLLMLW